MWIAFDQYFSPKARQEIIELVYKLFLISSLTRWMNKVCIEDDDVGANRSLIIANSYAFVSIRCIYRKMKKKNILGWQIEYGGEWDTWMQCVNEQQRKIKIKVKTKRSALARTKTTIKSTQMRWRKRRKKIESKPNIFDSSLVRDTSTDK